jgi:hypothetical protein
MLSYPHRVDFREECSGHRETPLSMGKHRQNWLVLHAKCDPCALRISMFGTCVLLDVRKGPRSRVGLKLHGGGGSYRELLVCGIVAYDFRQRHARQIACRSR